MAEPAYAEHAEVVVKLKEFAQPSGMSAASLKPVTLNITPVCPISTRPAYFGTRRIAPAAATSRLKAWGARPAVEELRPARRSFPRAPFVAQMVGQWDTPAEARNAARAYAAADALGFELPKIEVAAL